MGIEISGSAEWEVRMHIYRQITNHLCLIKCSVLSVKQI